MSLQVVTVRCYCQKCQNTSSSCCKTSSLVQIFAVTTTETSSCKSTAGSSVIL